MRSVTTYELRDYFQFAKKDRAAAGFNLDEATMIADRASESLVLRAIFNAISNSLVAGVPVEDLLLRLWVMGFQMGREFEAMEWLKPKVQ